MPTTGEQPGTGNYICNLCGEKVVLDNNTDTLPPCPYCYSSEYRQGD